MLPRWSCPCFVEGEDSNPGGTDRNQQSQISPDSCRCRAQALEGDIPMSSAGAIRLFPPSSQSLAACRESPVVQITAAFLSVPQVPPAFCPGVTGFHLLCCWVSGVLGEGNHGASTWGARVEPLQTHETSCLPLLPILRPGATRVPSALLCYAVSVPTA